MKTILFITSTRADYGLISSFYKSVLPIGDIKAELLVTGTHLLKTYGYTIEEINYEDIKIDYTVSIFDENIGLKNTSEHMATTLSTFSQFFEKCKPDYVALLGDRFEILSIALAAYNARIKVLHFYGGETTEGASDEAYRHMITKLSLFHFTSTEQYKKRVIQLGENPERVYNIGAIGIENILKSKKYSLDDINSILGINLTKPYAVATYHPETLVNTNPLDQIRIMLDTCLKQTNIQFVFTKSNADGGGQIINQFLEEHIDNISSNCFLFDSLGSQLYLSLLANASFVIGNSSSGIIEAPSFNIPTINIGDRQKGRLQSNSVINCNMNDNELINAISQAISCNDEIKSNFHNPYGNGKTTEYFIDIIKKLIHGDNDDYMKKFYDCEFEI